MPTNAEALSVFADFRKHVSTFPGYDQILNETALSLIGLPLREIELAIERHRLELVEAFTGVEWSPETKHLMARALTTLLWERIVEIGKCGGGMA